MTGQIFYVIARNINDAWKKARRAVGKNFTVTNVVQSLGGISGEKYYYVEAYPSQKKKRYI
jgi:hypothetical protein